MCTFKNIFLTCSCPICTTGDRAALSLSTSSADIPVESLARSSRSSVMQARLQDDALSSPSQSSTASAAAAICLYVPSSRVSRLVRAEGVLSLKRDSRRRSIERNCIVRWDS